MNKLKQQTAIITPLKSTLSFFKCKGLLLLALFLIGVQTSHGFNKADIEGQPLSTEWFKNLRSYAEVNPVATLNLADQWRAKAETPEQAAKFAALQVHLMQYLEDYAGLEAAINAAKQHSFLPIDLFDVELGKFYSSYVSGDLSKCLTLINNTISISNQIKNDNLLTIGLAWRSIVYAKLGKYGESKTDSLKVLELVQSIDNDFSIALAYYSIGEFFRTRSNNDQIIKYWIKSIEALERLGNYQQTAIYHYNIGILYAQLERYEDAINSFIFAIRFASQVQDDITVAYAQYRIARTESILGRSDSAYERMQESFSYFEKLNDMGLLIRATIFFADLAYESKNFKEAESLLNKALAISQQRNQTSQTKREIFSIQSKILTKSNKHSEALNVREQELDLINELYLEQTQLAIVKSKTEYEAHISDQIIDQLKAKKDLNDLKIKEAEYEKNLFAILSLVAVSFIISIGILLIHNIKLKQNLKNQSFFDSLTHLPNQRHIRNIVDSELERFQRYDRSFALAMVDIDLFKLFNEQHGKQNGDKLIKLLATLFSNRLRVEDRIGRHSGGSFLILLPETDETLAIEILDSIVRSVEDLSLEFIEKETVTVSIGYTTVNIMDTSAEKVIERAKQGLNIAKAKGRNRVEGFKQPEISRMTEELENEELS